MNALRTWREGNSLCLQQPGDLITVVGAAGGVGQILTAKLLEVCIPTPAAAISLLPELHDRKTHDLRSPSLFEISAPDFLLHLCMYL